MVDLLSTFVQFEEGKWLLALLSNHNNNIAVYENALLAEFFFFYKIAEGFAIVYPRWPAPTFRCIYAMDCRHVADFCVRPGADLGT